MKKNIIFLIIGCVILVCFILGTSLVWYNLFSDEIESGGSARIQLTSQKEGLMVTSAAPVEDEEGANQVPYSFQVTNMGNVRGNYKLIIEDTPFNKIDDGCTVDTLLNRNQLRYQLLLNGEEIKVDSLAKIKNNILDTRDIEPNVKNNYELRIWVNDEASNWENKHFHYSINLMPADSKEVNK